MPYDNFEEGVHPELREDFRNRIYGQCHFREEFRDGHFFPRQCCEEHKLYDSKMAGVFHLESVSTKYIALCSKAYVVQETPERVKFSAKGCQKRQMRNVFDTFREVLETGRPHHVVNRGFCVKGKRIHTYEQRKRGLTAFYCKREVLPDLIHTKPLRIAIRPYWRHGEEQEQTE